MSVFPTSLWWKNCGRSGKQQNYQQWLWGLQQALG